MDIKKYHLKVKFKKYKDMIYFSQLDLIHMLERALRRTNLPLYFTQGFNPHVKISFLNGLKVGKEGVIDAILYFSEQISIKKFRKELSLQLPEGVEITEIYDK